MHDGCVESDIRNISRPVGGNPGAGLPRRLGEENAGAAAACCQLALRSGLVPYCLGNVRDRRPCVRVVRRREVRSCTLVEHRPAHAGDKGRTGWKVDGKTLCCARHAVVAVRSARVAARTDDRDALRIGLLKQRVQGVQLRPRVVHLAKPVADRHDGCKAVVDRLGQRRIDHVRRVHVQDAGGGRGSSGPLDVKLRLIEIVRACAGIVPVDLHRGQIG